MSWFYVIGFIVGNFCFLYSLHFRSSTFESGRLFTFGFMHVTKHVTLVGGAAGHSRGFRHVAIVASFTGGQQI